MSPESDRLNAPAPQYLPQANRTGIALCLSGGGYRAALFHLGACKRLNELGVLGQIDTIASVSGGSIVAAHLATRVNPWPGDKEIIPPEVWEQKVAEPFRRFALLDIRTGPILERWLNPGKIFRPQTTVEALARIYEKKLTDLKFSQLPRRPRFIFCATDMAFGVNWVFERERAGDYQIGYILMRRFYFNGPGLLSARIDQSGNVAWYLLDRFDSTRGLMTNLGSLIDQITFDAWGNIVTETSPTAGDRFKFAGGEYNSITAFTHFGARFYDPNTGRWISQDPLSLGPDVNSYRYLHNSPTSGTDGTGQGALTPIIEAFLGFTKDHGFAPGNSTFVIPKLSIPPIYTDDIRVQVIYLIKDGVERLSFNVKVNFEFEGTWPPLPPFLFVVGRFGVALGGTVLIFHSAAAANRDNTPGVFPFQFAGLFLKGKIAGAFYASAGLRLGTKTFQGAKLYVEGGVAGGVEGIIYPHVETLNFIYYGYAIVNATFDFGWWKWHQRFEWIWGGSTLLD